MKKPCRSIRIGHFSDLHLLPERTVPPWTLLGKRALGFANLTLNRGRTHKKEHLHELLGRVVAEACDLVIVTGDFTSLALGFEFENIDGLFRENGLSPQNTVIIPGNHDRYTFLADKLDAFEAGMAAWMPASFHRATGYPMVRDIGPVRLMALDTAVWRNPVRAAGRIDAVQLERLRTALEGCGERWPFIALHHPPFHRGNATLRHYRTGLDNYKDFLEVVGDRAATVVHGHLHVCSRRRIGSMDVIGVPSASNNTGDPTTQLAYFVYTLNERGLEAAEVVRIWPDQTDPEAKSERRGLPEEMIA